MKTESLKKFSEAEKSSEEDNKKQGQKRRKYIGSSESEKYGKCNLIRITYLGKSEELLQQKIM